MTHDAITVQMDWASNAKPVYLCRIRGSYAQLPPSLLASVTHG